MKTLFYSLLSLLLSFAVTQSAVADSVFSSVTTVSLHSLILISTHKSPRGAAEKQVEVLDFAGPMEVFSAAGFDVKTVSKTKGPITSQGILKIIPDYTIDDAPYADIIVFFGGNSGNAANSPAVIKWLKNVSPPQYYMSVCTGAFVLGKAGLLDHLTVTTFHDSIDRLQAAVPLAKVLANVRFVDNGRIITTAGVSAGIDGALHVVEKLLGSKAAQEVVKYMEYDKWVPGQGLVIDKKQQSR